MLGISVTIIWLIIFAVLVLVEFATMGLTTIWFAGGALISIVLSIIGLPLWIQIAAFIVVSGLLLYFTRPIAVKYFNKTRTRTNIESKIGQQAIVISEIDNVQGIGQVKIAGMDWSARSFDGNPIEVGAVVVVESVEGVKLIVKKEEK